MTIYNTADNVNDFKYVGWVLTQQKRMKNIKQN